MKTRIVQWIQKHKKLLLFLVCVTGVGVILIVYNWGRIKGVLKLVKPDSQTLDAVASATAKTAESCLPK